MTTTKPQDPTTPKDDQQSMLGSQARAETHPDPSRANNFEAQEDAQGPIAKPSSVPGDDPARQTAPSFETALSVKKALSWVTDWGSLNYSPFGALQALADHDPGHFHQDPKRLGMVAAKSEHLWNDPLDSTPGRDKKHIAQAALLFNKVKPEEISDHPQSEHYLANLRKKFLDALVAQWKDEELFDPPLREDEADTAPRYAHGTILNAVGMTYKELAETPHVNRVLAKPGEQTLKQAKPDVEEFLISWFRKHNLDHHHPIGSPEWAMASALLQRAASHGQDIPNGLGDRAQLLKEFKLACNRWQEHPQGMDPKEQAALHLARSIGMRVENAAGEHKAKSVFEDWLDNASHVLKTEHAEMPAFCSKQPGPSLLEIAQASAQGMLQSGFGMIKGIINNPASAPFYGSGKMMYEGYSCNDLKKLGLGTTSMVLEFASLGKGPRAAGVRAAAMEAAAPLVTRMAASAARLETGNMSTSIIQLDIESGGGIWQVLGKSNAGQELKVLNSRTGELETFEKVYGTTDRYWKKTDGERGPMLVYDEISGELKPPPRLKGGAPGPFGDLTPQQIEEEVGGWTLDDRLQNAAITRARIIEEGGYREDEVWVRVEEGRVFVVAHRIETSAGIGEVIIEWDPHPARYRVEEISWSPDKSEAISLKEGGRGELLWRDGRVFVELTNVADRSAAEEIASAWDFLMGTSKPQGLGDIVIWERGDRWGIFREAPASASGILDRLVEQQKRDHFFPAYQNWKAGNVPKPIPEELPEFVSPNGIRVLGDPVPGYPNVFGYRQGYVTFLNNLEEAKAYKARWDGQNDRAAILRWRGSDEVAVYTPGVNGLDSNEFLYEVRHYRPKVDFPDRGYYIPPPVRGRLPDMSTSADVSKWSVSPREIREIGDPVPHYPNVYGYDTGYVAFYPNLQEARIAQTRWRDVYENRLGDLSPEVLNTAEVVRWDNSGEIGLFIPGVDRGMWREAFSDEEHGFGGPFETDIEGESVPEPHIPPEGHYVPPPEGTPAPPYPSNNVREDAWDYSQAHIQQHGDPVSGYPGVYYFDGRYVKFTEDAYSEAQSWNALYGMPGREASVAWVTGDQLPELVAVIPGIPPEEFGRYGLPAPSLTPPPRNRRSVSCEEPAVHAEAESTADPLPDIPQVSDAARGSQLEAPDAVLVVLFNGFAGAGETIDLRGLLAGNQNVEAGSAERPSRTAPFEPTGEVSHGAPVEAQEAGVEAEEELTMFTIGIQLPSAQNNSSWL
ncbi:hypothetical protein ACFQU1_03495 [Chelatococcus sp. GCM10030263]|uniref:hypothetical protein n=1 Tax=Chelatococcus sp. GCM10030263 TaxID=3273387 RepID=UPI00360DB077